MDVRSSSLASGSHPSRILCKEYSTSRVSLRSANVRAHSRANVPPSSVASTGDFETESNDDHTSDSRNRVSRSNTEEESRKKLEVVTGLLKEGYGVGAILTAAAFRGASITTDVVKGMTQGSTAAVRRQKKQRSQERPSKKPDPSILEKLQQAVSESLTATPITWRQKSDHVLKAEMMPHDGTPQEGEFLEEPEESTLSFQNGEDESHISAESVHEFESSPMMEPEKEKTERQGLPGEVEDRMAENEDRGVLDFKTTLGIPEDEPLSSRHISEERLKPSAFLDAAEEGIFGTEMPEEMLVTEDDEEVDPEQETSAEFTDATMNAIDANVLEDLVEDQEAATEKEVTPDLHGQANLEISSDVVEGIRTSEMTLESNVEAFQSPSLEEERGTEDDEDEEESSIAMHRAKEILDEIANFEIETGEPVYSSGEEEEAAEEEEVAEEPKAVEESPPQPPEKSRAEIEQELKEQMRVESEKRLRAMKIGSETRYQGERPVKVERPSTEQEGKATGAPTASPAPMAPPTQKFRGLDYIKSFAKEKQTPEETTKDSSASFFTPPPILQDSKKTQVTQAASSPTRGYSQGREVDRLKRVREIGTVMWLGRGGSGGSGGNGGSGGGGGRGRGRSGENSDDKHWWLQVGFSMMTMTALVFALLTAISNHLEKQQRTKVQGNQK